MGLYYELEEKENARKKRNREILIWIGELAAVILVSYLIVAFGMVRISMIGDSMNPTLQDGNSIIVNKMSYRFTKPKRNDVIVFKQSGSEHSYYNVKRVIGLPGETIQIKEGDIYVNGERLKEEFHFEPISNGGLANEEIKLDAKEYFVLGDNRNASEDSRFANIGIIIKKDIVGSAWIRVKPFGFVNKIRVQSEEK
ncbi:signal peptidase I [[Clostridium] polysaccharolyticum]|uniref:Signal peptidase I n=1 Tax=[Clostridium] polysaccharolyticum TaxID=29364 RepID=A0A1I0FHN4_9FIRM|nr:signal peptidase I [[Clostridium] polysaccharolyticum]SET57815.1 signal peptidase I [[Clostridium] polysaccharolyticum]